MSRTPKQSAPDRPSTPIADAGGTGESRPVNPTKAKRPPRPGSLRAVAERHAAAEAAANQAAIDLAVRCATESKAVGRRGLGQLARIIDDGPARDDLGKVDPAYIQALRLALQAAGMLKDQVEVAGKEGAPPAAVFVLPMKDKDG